MREVLTPILGETGAAIAQYLITFAIILGVIVAIVWAVRRYAWGAVGPASRGRLPRLAVVDALAVDGRRRLVLVRRDNIEHLLLIGGPSDIVVEPSIVRTRVAQRPGQPLAGRGQAQPAAAAPQPAPPPPPPSPERERSALPAPGRAAAVRAPRTPPSTGDDPIPFPPRRAAARFAAREPAERPMPAATAPAPEAEPEPAAAPPERPASRQPAPRVAPPAKAEAPAAAPAMPTEPLPLPPRPRVEAGHADSPFAPPDKAVHRAPPLPASEADDDERIMAAAAALRPAADTEEPERPPPGRSHAPDDREADVVSDLEEDMARLLGQIAPRR